jgi:hypothetical protein
MAATSSARRWRPTGRSAAAARAVRAWRRKDEDFVRVCSPPTPTADPVLLVDRHGLQAEGLAPAARPPHRRGKAMVNMLPLAEGERITS